MSQTPPAYAKAPDLRRLGGPLQETARLYRKSLWADTDLEVEVWLEKAALAGVLYPVTAEFDVPLMPTGGYTSETFAHSAVARLEGTGRTLVIHALYDFDRSGEDAARSLAEKVERFGEYYDVPVVFNSLGLSLYQVRFLELPTRPAKGATVADQRWPRDFAAELDANSPYILRDMVRSARAAPPRRSTRPPQERRRARTRDPSAFHREGRACIFVARYSRIPEG